jgi:hypothetical protein
MNLAPGWLIDKLQGMKRTFTQFQLSLSLLSFYENPFSCLKLFTDHLLVLNPDLRAIAFIHFSLTPSSSSPEELSERESKEPSSGFTVPIFQFLGEGLSPLPRTI